MQTNEFEVDSTSAIFSTWKFETEDPLDKGDVKIRNEDEWVIEIIFDWVRAGRKKDKSMFEINPAIAPGVLTSIDKVFMPTLTPQSCTGSTLSETLILPILLN